MRQQSIAESAPGTCYTLSGMTLDFHTHIFPKDVRENVALYQRLDPGFNEIYSLRNAKIISANDLIDALDRAEIGQAVINSFGWSNNELCAKHNDTIIDAVQRYPERLIGFFTVRPSNDAETINEMHRCIAAGLKGLGEMRPSNQGWNLKSPLEYSDFTEVIKNNNLCVLMHSSEPLGHQYPGKGTTYPQELEHFLSAHTELNVILAHWGGGLPLFSHMPEIKQLLENTYFDIAATPYIYDSGIYRTMINIIGIQNIVFGSDYPLMPYEKVFDHLEKAELTQTEIETILVKNGQRILNSL